MDQVELTPCWGVFFFVLVCFFAFWEHLKPNGLVFLFEPERKSVRKSKLLHSYRIHCTFLARGSTVPHIDSMKWPK